MAGGNKILLVATGYLLFCFYAGAQVNKPDSIKFRHSFSLGGMLMPVLNGTNSLNSGVMIAPVIGYEYHGKKYFWRGSYSRQIYLLFANERNLKTKLWKSFFEAANIGILTPFVNKRRKSTNQFGLDLVWIKKRYTQYEPSHWNFPHERTTAYKIGLGPVIRNDYFLSQKFIISCELTVNINLSKYFIQSISYERIDETKWDWVTVDESTFYFPWINFHRFFSTSIIYII